MKYYMGIDIGIKNLSICIIEKNKWLSYVSSTNQKKDEMPNTKNFQKNIKSGIIYWKILNLLDIPKKCCSLLKNKKPCSCKASYKNPIDNQVYCKKHCPKNNQCEFIITKTANQITSNDLYIRLISILQQEKELMHYEYEAISIELQPRFNAKMKNLSVAIHSILLYEIMLHGLHIPKKISYSHAKNKWKVIQKFNYPIGDIKKNYKKGKEVAINFTKHILQKDETAYHIIQQETKKDDLADSFLHCLWNMV